MSTRNRFITNTAINIANTVMSFLIAYAMTPFILHRMGSEAYGIWVFLGIFSISGYFSLLDFGFQGATTKYVAEYHTTNQLDQLEKVVNAALFFFFIAGVAATLFLVIFNVFFLHNVFHIPEAQQELVSLLVMILAASFLFQFPALALSAIVEGLQRYDYLRGVTILATIMSNLALLVWLRGSEGSLLLVVGVTLAASLLMTLGYLWVVKKLLPGIRMSFFHLQKETLRRLIPLSSKLFVSKIVGLVFNNTDKILIGIFLTVDYQTQYDIVNKAHIILLSILSIFNQAVLPASSEFSAKNDSATLQQLLLRSTKYAAAFVLPAYIFLMIFPSQFLHAWVGTDFQSLGPVVRLYSSHIILTMLVGVSSTMLVGINKVGQVLKISILAAIINLVISVITVQRFGIAGIIFGTVVAYFISSLMYVVITNNIFSIRHKFFLRRVVTPLLPAIAITTLMGFGIRPVLHATSLLPWTGVAIVLYVVFFGIFWFTGLGIDERDFLTRNLVHIFRKISGKKPTV